MSKEKVITLLEAAGVGRYAEQIAAFAMPSLRVELKPVGDEERISVGSSKVGGAPDLPDSVEWPYWKQYPMTFIAQFRLTELPKGDAASALPADGLLSFFYAVQPMYEDFDDFFGDKATCKVIYTAPESLVELQRRALPEQLSGGESEAIMRPNRVSFTEELCVPASESAYLESLGLGWSGNREDFDKYWENFLPAWRGGEENDSYKNRLLGHPDQIQGDMQGWCEQKARGLSYDEARDPAISEEIKREAVKWRLLLQIDSEEEKTGIMWGDVGRIYFWIREEDLAAGQFDRVICDMQCC